jgi:hypothetical protein
MLQRKHVRVEYFLIKTVVKSVHLIGRKRKEQIWTSFTSFGF